ncbi:MAG: hypothetical protein K0S53_1315 [Bacteroidetes bacterium]|jgi:hypothetical protein|nr:hypothetical protein [Bacteroidota bacterium]MDF2452389.1 hypothetical protein [Bacteroidota bacterium]
MKKILFSIATIITLSATAQTTISFNPRTGDAEMDASLKNINVKAQADLPLFKSELSASFQIGVPKINVLLQTMAPADVYMAAEMANILNKPVETVADSYKKNKDKGWGQIAKELGIKPGSKEFHEMKARFKSKGNKSDKGGKGNSGSHGNGKGKGKK